MPKEIEFRAWDEVGKFMLEIDTLIFCAGGTKVLGPGSGSGWAKVNLNFKNRLTKTMELMEFIGTKDNHGHGKKIYKGDIVRITAACGEEYIGEVVWDESRLGWAVDCEDLEELYGFATIIHCEHLVEVLGNIHENPDLLELSNAN